MSDVKRTPSSTAFESATVTTAGVGDDGQASQGHPAGSAAVVKLHVVLAASGVPEPSLARGSALPPCSVAT